MTIRVFLLDDHEIVRRGLRELLETVEDMASPRAVSTGKLRRALRWVKAPCWHRVQRLRGFRSSKHWSSL